MRILISISVLFFYALLLQAKNEVIDYGQFLCSYYYCYSKDTIKNDEKGEDLLFLSIGKNVSKCYSYYTYQSDSFFWLSGKISQNATAIIRISRIL